MADLTCDKICNIRSVCYCTGVRCCALGACVGGGNVFAKRGSFAWIVAPATSEVSRCWVCRVDAVITACAAAACDDWYIPSRNDLFHGFECKSFWNAAKCACTYWSDTEYSFGPGSPLTTGNAYGIIFYKGGCLSRVKVNHTFCVRAFRKLYY